ncbi:RagB/SusD family nutrient uptake outer membrane protein [Pedobacter gandavensis]|uniref:RagB/SusD family nutrient uptake outer membrane protein n=1 Tax=Pedobacter gandavensis TaxID=2679963 RepID=A0ABR6EU38_9SPHI|nr:RagB/SusD family nutrient uptake outer membrane protein [Pedobacter gandavensis]MBB2148486.1 RagB/SusD family nutrient uptake outer membrane protein [Pedobacter gandavensis]
MKYLRIYFILIGSVFFISCTKNFLDAKPNSFIVTPNTLQELQVFLDNGILNRSGGLPQVSSDEFFIPNKVVYDALNTQTQKNGYLWKQDIYKGERVPDWNEPYTAVFYANSALDELKKIEANVSNQKEWNNIKGTALFFRAFSYFDLARNFCQVYNEASASNDLGLPLRTSAGIDKVSQRSSLRSTFDLMISDLNEAKFLLNDDSPSKYRNRPSKSAVYGLLARIYLYMGNYVEAEKAADECLLKYSTLINFNNISTSAVQPFLNNYSEIIFYSIQVVAYPMTVCGGRSNQIICITPDLISLYEVNDLRLPGFFAKNTLNNYVMKTGYGIGLYPFTGLTTAEVLLIKAECAARRNDPQDALGALNLLLSNRCIASTYVEIRSLSAEETLKRVLLERRKELVWRNLRWSDIKRYNRDGANITLKRNLDGVEYSLAPNSPLYVFPIPDEELLYSGIKPNVR